jgi:hypothetical protein
MMSFDASKMMQAVTAGAGAAAVPGIRQKPVQLSPPRSLPPRSRSRRPSRRSSSPASCALPSSA